MIVDGGEIMKNVFYVILFLVGMIVGPTLLRFIGVPSFDVVLTNLFGDNKGLGAAFSAALIAIIIYITCKAIQKQMPE